jgi:hypothetical protein
MSVLLGYFFCLTTAGLSLLCPWICIKEAQEQFLYQIDRINKEVFNKHKLHLSYHNICITSWLQIDILDYHTLESINESYINDNNSKIEIEMDEINKI